MKMLNKMKICLFTIVLILISLLLCYGATSTDQEERGCTAHDAKGRCLPHSDCWPHRRTWDAFNSSVGGRLLRPRPSAAPCHLSNDDNLALSARSCRNTVRNWHNPFWRSDQPGAMQSANKEAANGSICELTPSLSHTPCYQGSVAAYAVRVSDASHVQAAVHFASHHNIRLSVKSTGHDFMGRSTAPGSLNIWMQHLKGITFHDCFRPENCSREFASVVTSESGVTWHELYEAADAHGRVVVGAMGSTVSTAGGYLQGGGHSPLAPLLGLAADHVIEYKVVTADGKLRTANACQNQDLFWALRGGGGGTFGVVILATLRTYPALSSILSITFTAVANSPSSFQGLLTKFVELHPLLSESDSWAAYSSINSTSITGEYFLPRMSSDVPTKIADIDAFKPMIAHIDRHPRRMRFILHKIQAFPSFLAWYTSSMCDTNPGVCAEATGNDVALASRLLPKELLKNNATEVAETFIRILRSGVAGVTAHLVSGRAVAAAKQNNSVNPAWRTSIWHVIPLFVWSCHEAECATEEVERMRLLTRGNGLLRKLAPHSGSYLNEADFNEPEWQSSFFGGNYERLLAIKQQVDPHTLFTCRKCVGSC